AHGLQRGCDRCACFQRSSVTEWLTRERFDRGSDAAIFSRRRRCIDSEISAVVLASEFAPDAFDRQEHAIELLLETRGRILALAQTCEGLLDDRRRFQAERDRLRPT